MTEMVGITKTDIGFNDTDVHADKIAADSDTLDHGEDGFDTGVNGIKATAEKGGLPMFDVTPGEFYNNMKIDRRKMVFKRGTPAQQYHAGTNYKQHFWIRNADDGYMRKISR